MSADDRVPTYDVRASSWGGLFDCAHKWEWEVLDGRRKPSGLRALLGTALHASTAENDRFLVAGKPESPVVSAAVFIDELYHPNFDVDYGGDDLTVKDAERVGLALHTLYCTRIAPTMGYVDVETALAPMVIHCGSVNVRLTGTMDRGRVVAGVAGPVIPDIKTGRAVIENRVAKTKGRAAQLGTYQLLYEHTKKVKTAGAQVIGLSTTSKPEVAVSPIFDARRVMVGDADKPGLIEYAAEMFRSGMFPPNPQSVLCSKKFCARWDSCNFHE